MQILQTPEGWFTNLMMEMSSIRKAVILHRSKEIPFSKLLPEGKFVIHKVCAVNEPAPAMLCCHSTAKLEPQIQGIIFNSSPLKILFVINMAKMMIAMRAPCAALPPLKRGCFPLFCAVFSQTVKKKKKSMYNYLESKQVSSVAEWIAPGIISGLKQWESSFDEGKPLFCHLPPASPLSCLSGGVSIEMRRLPLLSSHCWSISLDYLSC